MPKIVVVGGGGHAKVLISVLKRTGLYRIIGYTDTRDNGDLLGAPYLGNDDTLAAILKREGRCAAGLGVGSIRISEDRRCLMTSLEEMGFDLPAIASPAAVVNEGVSIGKGSVVFDGVVINTGTRIGDGCIINTGSTVDHDCRIGDFAHVAPGVTLSGGVKIGADTFVGAGATVIQCVSICDNCLIGAGATVVADIRESGVYVGIPARRIR